MEPQIEDFSAGGPATDDDLVRRSQHDAQAFAAVYQRYAKRVYRYAYRRVGDAAAAQDVTSQIFFDALVALPRYRPRGLFGAWLFAIARRRCADHFRRRSQARRPDDSWPAPADPGPDAEALCRLRDILGTITDKERELLSLRYAGELSHREIGRLTGKSEAAIKMAMVRLIRKMKALWESQDD
jgi:RNA polymerase sigma-70 factor (ECF subfamily)